MLHRQLATMAALCLAAQFADSAEFPPEIITSGSSNLNVDASPHNGVLAIDLLGTIWTVPRNGGEARAWTDGRARAARPRWSPDGSAIAYQLRMPSGGEIWKVEIATAKNERLVAANGHAQDATWHPSSTRVTFASDRNGQGLDLWEQDLRTGLQWKLTDHPGDEIEPAWSANGRHLMYIRRYGQRYSLVLRRHGEAEVELVNSDLPIASLSWRPDGSLVTFAQQIDGEWVLQMLILSSPPLLRHFASVNNLHVAPVSWIDRMQLVYTANGKIMSRGFEDRRATPIHFRAMRSAARETAESRFVANREIQAHDVPGERLVIRGQRLFDGIRDYYQEQVDVLIEGGVITSLSPRQDWPDMTVLDLGDVTIMPGLIDAWAGLPTNISAQDGARILAYGVTTVVSPDLSPAFDPLIWESAATPGPRVLGAARHKEPQTDAAFYLAEIDVFAASAEFAGQIDAWHGQGVPVIALNNPQGLGTGADAYLGAHALTASGTDSVEPRFAAPADAVFLSGLADARTPNLDHLFDSRQARAFGHTRLPSRRFFEEPRLSTSPALVVAASRPNGLPTGIALHAEIAAMTATGFAPAQALQAAGRNAARFLGVEDRVGTLVSGALADLILVSGDPLADTGDALDIVAVVRNGRFFSQVNLLER